MKQHAALNKQRIEIIQINAGSRCNQRCAHCHVRGGPDGTSMDRHTALMILEKLAELSVRSIEFTGGAPELNPNLKLFIEQLAADGRLVTVRTNLTVLALADYAEFFQLYRTHRVKLVASLPCYLRENVDRQRGQGVFDASIAVLRILNSIGYGTDGLELDLVYNPLGDVLPPDQQSLEMGYRRALNDIGVTFNNLIAITNAPIGRFRERLAAENRYGDYMNLLRCNFNAATSDRLMCRTLLSIDYRGSVYDCDFNLALGLKIKGYEEAPFWNIDFAGFSPEITFGEHCWACTSGAGSSCHGALLADNAVCTEPAHCENSFSHL
jgi:radical SAM/Cys-rich protein